MLAAIAQFDLAVVKKMTSTGVKKHLAPEALHETVIGS